MRFLIILLSLMALSSGAFAASCYTPLQAEAEQGLRIHSELMVIGLESAEEWPAGTRPVTRVSYPDGTTEEVTLDRISDTAFETVVPARQGGTYAVGVSVDGPDDEVVVLSTLATRSFAAEYLPGAADSDLMASVSASTGGRGEIQPEQAFDTEGLEAGVTERHFRWWFLLLAALLWPVDVALRADEHQAGGGAGVGEVAVLAQEAVARVHGVGARAARGVDQRVDVQVGAARLRRADRERRTDDRIEIA